MRTSMEVLEESDSPVLLSNAEVLDMLDKNISKRNQLEADQKSKGRRKDKPSKFCHRDWIEKQVRSYLQRTPCVNIHDTSKLHELKSKLMASKKQLQSTGSTKKLTGFNLTEAESLQIANFMPTEPVEIHLMVEEMHSRMSEDRQGDLLELIASYRKHGRADNSSDNVGDGAEGNCDKGDIGELEDLEDFPLNPIKAEEL